MWQQTTVIWFQLTSLLLHYIFGCIIYPFYDVDSGRVFICCFHTCMLTLEMIDAAVVFILETLKLSLCSLQFSITPIADRFFLYIIQSILCLFWRAFTFHNGLCCLVRVVYRMKWVCVDEGQRIFRAEGLNSEKKIFWIYCRFFIFEDLYITTCIYAVL